ncbi:MAG: XdhC family protein [Elusimicrobia bacterium]|nr:XdhC family protein [Elusimicrobiota bacterium]
MNSIRPGELLELVEIMEDLIVGDSRPAALATVVSLDGSVYSRAGAMAVLVAGPAERSGVIPAFELSAPWRRACEELFAGSGSRLSSFETAEDDPILGFGLGAPGRLEVFFEPINFKLLEPLRRIREIILRDQGLVCVLRVEGGRVGQRVLYSPNHPSVRECYRETSPELVESASSGGTERDFLCPIRPMGKVLIFGSGRDAAKLSRHLSGLGFSVYAADPRPGRLGTEEWGSRRFALIEGGWEQMRRAAVPDEETSIVVMTHSYALDLETLQGALKSPASYVGLIGPARRTRKILAELSVLEVLPRPGILFAPAGLDLGAETPEETALSVASEILAVRSGRGGRSISGRGRDLATMTGRRARSQVPRGRVARMAAQELELPFIPPQRRGF